MKLYYSSASPYARKIRVLLRELQISCEEKVVATKDNDPDFIAANPLGKVPVLVDQGQSSLDSNIIALYLTERSELGSSWPSTWQEKVGLSTLDGLTDQAITMIVEKTRPDALVYDYWIDRYRQSIPSTLAWFWQNHRKGLDSQKSMASITLACLLEYLEFRHPEVSWDKSCPEMKPWLSEITARPSFLQTKPQ